MALLSGKGKSVRTSQAGGTGAVEGAGRVGSKFLLLM